VRISHHVPVRVVVSGGTGFEGRAIVAMLAARGDEVVVLSRSEGKGEARVRVVGWTPRAAGPWQREIEAADAVVSLAGAGVMDERWTRARLTEIRASRAEPTRLIAEAIARAETKPALVGASAVGIYGMRTDDLVMDEGSPHGTDVLAEICDAWEKEASRAAEAGARVALARIGIVLGKGGGALDKMAAPFRAFVGGPIGDGKQWMSWVHLEDTVRAIAFALDTATFSGPFNVCAPRPVTMSDFARALGIAVGRPARMRVPAFALRAALGHRASVLLTGQRVVPKHLEAAGFRFAFPGLEAALADIMTRA
jgi:uncharacterized protein (TIGR01777 family)